MRCFKKVQILKSSEIHFYKNPIAQNMQMNIKTERKEDDLWGTIEMSFNNQY